MKHITINVPEKIKYISGETIEKDLQDNEEICRVCNGLGIVKTNYPYGIESGKKGYINWYKNEYFTLCPNCYFGVEKRCKYCGKYLPKGSSRCNCAEYKAYKRAERERKYQETIDKAKEINWKQTSYYVYDDKSDKYFTDDNEFVEYYLQEYSDGSGGCKDFDEYFECEVPKVLWNCEKIKMSMDADGIIDSACDDLHEDARDNISGQDQKELQDFLDKWCEKQSGTTTYYPCYCEYIKVEKEWFTQCMKN